MDVTRDNFERAVQILEKELSSCSFAAIDLEFTGLGEERPSPLDTPAHRYRMMRESATDFPPLQFGLTLFREITTECVNDDGQQQNVARSGDTLPSPEDHPKWEMLPFNFSLCPRAVFRDAGAKYPIRDRMMQVQASTIEFLCKNGFDFQKSFDSGISWLRQSDEHSSKTELLACYKPPNAYVPEMDERESAVVHKFCSRIREWLTKTNHVIGSSTMFCLSEFNVNRQYLVRAIEMHFPKLSVMFADGGRKLSLPPSVRVEVFETKEEAIEVTKEQLKRIYEEKIERNIREAVGFRRVIDMLREAKKPLVVHHGMFDTTKLIANFIGDLPETLSGFKRDLLSHFPVVWDTRVLLTAAAGKYVWLNNFLVTEEGRHITGIIDKLRNHRDDVPSLTLKIFETWEFERYDGLHVERFSHEAGFDSLQTGRLLLYLVAMAQGRPTRAGDVRDACEHENLAQLHNRIYLGSCGGYRDITLNEAAKERALVEDEEAVEDARNKWMARDDILVMSGVADEQSKKLEGWEIPYPFYRRVLDELFQDTPYCGRESTVLPSANGVCIFIPKKARAGAEPVRKKPRTEQDKSSSDESMSTSSTGAEYRTTGCYDVTAMECADESGITEEDLKRIHAAAKEKGIEIRTYREALRMERGRRMRFLL